MANYSHLEIDLPCPACGTIVIDLLWFQWGFSRGYGVRDELIYYLGDAIRWQRTKARSILPWVYFYQGDPNDNNSTTSRGSNHGDPAINDLLICVHTSFYWEEPDQRRHCPNCGMIHEGAVIEIRQGSIKSARIYKPGEFDNPTAIYILDPSGLVKPMPEWIDYPMGAVYNILPDDE